jgi:hypothetical protein
MNWHRFSSATALAVLCLSTLAACGLLKKKGGEEEKKDGAEKTEDAAKSAEVSAEGPSVDIAFLLSMNYAEAKSISANFIEVPPFYRIAADEIEVTKKNDDGSPRRLRAKGRVFLEMNYNDPGKALCQELLLSSEEIILRGKPVLQRGGTTVEGVDDYTIFYMFGSRLRVIGPHRLTNPMQLASGLDASGLPTLGAWSNAPNPLLPPLNEAAVPEQIRAEALRATEAEMLHQKTRVEFGPAEVPAANPPAAEAKKEPAKPSKAPEPKKAAEPKKQSKGEKEATKAAA